MSESIVGILRASSARASAMLLGLFVFAVSAHAEISVSASSEQTGYVRGQTNTFVFHLALFSNVFELADNIHFGFPPGITISAARYIDEGQTNCPDALLLVLGMGTSDGGWFNPGHPSSCGHFDTSADGTPQVFSIDADIPEDYVGDLPVLIRVEGDGCCDPPPHDDSTTLTFADLASSATWNFDDVLAPTFPAGWRVASVGDAVGWAVTRAGAGSAPNDVHTPAGASRGETILASAQVAIDPAGGELRFRHRYATQAGSDGGVLEIAIDDGAAQDIVSAGGVFRTGGYSGSIEGNDACSGADTNPLLGRDAWTGTQEAYETVAVTLPAAAAGHLVRFGWVLGTDCAGAPADPNGWWIDDVVVGPSTPSAAMGPDKLAVTLETGAHRSDTLSIGNVGGGALDFAVTTASADADCSAPSNISWLHADANGTIGGGEHVDLPLRIDAGSLAVGSYAALVCASTSAGTSLAMPVNLSVTAGPCAFADRLLASGFEETSNDQCGESVRTFTRRDAFLFQTAAGHVLDHYTGLRTGRLTGPVAFGNGTFDYSVFTVDGEINSLFLIGGSGVLSGTVPGNHVALTFTGAPVTAFGANAWGTEFSTNSTPETSIVLNFDNGSSETFLSGSRDTFRGFITTTPMHGVSVSAPELVNGDLLDAVFDNVVVGRAR